MNVFTNKLLYNLYWIYILRFLLEDKLTLIKLLFLRETIVE